MRHCRYLCGPMSTRTMPVRPVSDTGIDARRRRPTLATLATCIAAFIAACIATGTAAFIALFPAPAAQAVTLQALPYRDPAPLDALLALNDVRFGATLAAQWPAVGRTIASYLPAGAALAGTSAFADASYARCWRLHEPGACRLLMDLLSFEMKSRRPQAQPPSLPVLMRPAQLPWKDTALPRALLAIDGSQLQSALNSHWRWFKGIVTRFLPDATDLHPISKVFGSLRDTCQAMHTEIACRNHLQDVVGIIDANRRQPPAVIRTLAQIPYRDPSPLERLLALDETALRSELADWPAIDALVNQYIPATVAIAGDVDFARMRLDCQAWFPGDFFLCRNYIARLSRLMQGKATMANPFQASS